MKSLSDLLKNHPVPGIREAETRRICAEALSKVTGVTILPKQIKYTDGNLSLKVAPIVKSALTIKFEEAKTELEKGGVKLVMIR